MNPEKSRLVLFHYGWLVVFAGVLALFIALGLGRFALGMLLPSMSATLDLDYAQMGFISTGNFMGYLAGVVLSRYGVARYGLRGLISAGLLMLSVSMVMISRAESFAQVLSLYCLTGLASGAVNVPVMALVTPWFSSNWRGRAAGIMTAGNGLGLMFSGMLIPFINGRIGAEGWRTSWLVFGIIAAAAMAICLVILRDRPRDMGLSPLGGEPDSSAAHGPVKAVTGHPNRWIMLQLSSAYFLFGFTYAIYVTFIVTTLVQERGFSETAAGNVWFWIGFLSLFSGFVFGALSDRFGRKTGLMLVFTLQGLAYMLAAVPLSNLFLYFSVALFGLCAWSIPSIMTATVGDYLGAQRAVAALGVITFFFGIGQITGPALAGVLAEQSGQFASSYWLAALLAGSAILITATLRRPS